MKLLEEDRDYYDIVLARVRDHKPAAISSGLITNIDSLAMHGEQFLFLLQTCHEFAASYEHYLLGISS